MSQSVSGGEPPPPADPGLLGLVALAAIHLDLADECLAAAYPLGQSPHLAPWAFAHTLLRRALIELHALLPVPPLLRPKRSKA